MTRERNVGKRYARALFELAVERGQEDAISEELRAAAAAMSEPEAADFFRHPSIGVEQKLGVLDQALAGRVSEPVLHTLHLLIRRGRMAALDVLVSHFESLSDERAGRVTAVVTTPLPLTDQQAADIAAHYAELTGKQVRVHNEIDKALLGGMQVRIGDRLYDASLSTKLARLKKQLA